MFQTSMSWVARLRKSRFETGIAKLLLRALNLIDQSFDRFFSSTPYLRLSRHSFKCSDILGISNRVELVLYVATNPKETTLAHSQQEKPLANAVGRGAYRTKERRIGVAPRSKRRAQKMAIRKCPSRYPYCADSI